MKREAFPLQAPAPDYVRYEIEKLRWVVDHPDATPAEYERAMRAIASRCGV